jgi:hypothetical protein
MKRFILAFLAAYIFLFVWGWLFNGVFLKDVYAETPNLWRSQSEMASLFHWIVIGQALVVFSFVMIYASGFAGGGVIAGIRLGLLLEIAAIGIRLGFYAVQPIPGKLILYGSEITCDGRELPGNAKASLARFGALAKTLSGNAATVCT